MCVKPVGECIRDSIAVQYPDEPMWADHVASYGIAPDRCENSGPCKGTSSAAGAPCSHICAHVTCPQLGSHGPKAHRRLRLRSSCAILSCGNGLYATVTNIASMAFSSLRSNGGTRLVIRAPARPVFSRSPCLRIEARATRAGVGMLGTKAGMTTIFQEDGTAVPCTVIGFESPNYVTQKFTKEEHGYDAVQVRGSACCG